MSKIVEALEKAKREGKLENTSVTLDERSTVSYPAPLPETVPASAPVRELSLRANVSGVTSIDPAALAVIDPRIETLHNPMSVVSEQYRQLRSRLERKSLDREQRVLAVTSSIKGEGKSVTAVNLAVVLAQIANKSTLLLDSDFRRPNVHRLLGMAQEPGLSDYLVGRASLEQVLHATPFLGLSVVTAGSGQGHPAELLASPEFGAFVSWCRSQYDYVLIDTPPVQPISDVGFLVEFVDGVLLVVRSAKTGKELVKKAVESLPDGKIVGAVLNRVDSLGQGYGYKKGAYGYYGGY